MIVYIYNLYIWLCIFLNGYRATSREPHKHNTLNIFIVAFVETLCSRFVLRIVVHIFPMISCNVVFNIHICKNNLVGCSDGTVGSESVPESFVSLLADFLDESCATAVFQCNRQRISCYTLLS